MNTTHKKGKVIPVTGCGGLFYETANVTCREEETSGNVKNTPPLCPCVTFRLAA
jgi:hypothetical protein